MALLSTMAALALLLSVCGIFALVANIVAQKTREIGIRIALGSTIRQAWSISGPGVRAQRWDSSWVLSLRGSAAGDAQCALWRGRL